MKKTLKIGIGVGVAAIALYFINKNKAKADAQKTANTTPDTPTATPTKSVTGTPNAPTGTPTVSVIIYPNEGEPEKVSNQLRSMKVRGTNTVISLWSDPYDVNAYFVRFDEIVILKWTKATYRDNNDSYRKEYMPLGMTFLNTTAYPTLYKPYDVARNVKGGRYIEGYVGVAHEMLIDLKLLALESPELSLYL